MQRELASAARQFCFNVRKDDLHLIPKRIAGLSYVIHIISFDSAAPLLSCTHPSISESTGAVKGTANREPFSIVRIAFGAGSKEREARLVVSHQNPSTSAYPKQHIRPQNSLRISAPFAVLFAVPPVCSGLYRASPRLQYQTHCQVPRQNLPLIRQSIGLDSASSCLITGSTSFEVFFRNLTLISKSYV